MDHFFLSRYGHPFKNSFWVPSYALQLLNLKIVHPERPFGLQHFLQSDMLHIQFIGTAKYSSPRKIQGTSSHLLQAPSHPSQLTMPLVKFSGFNTSMHLLFATSQVAAKQVLYCLRAVPISSECYQCLRSRAQDYEIMIFSFIFLLVGLK